MIAATAPSAYVASGGNDPKRRATCSVPKNVASKTAFRRPAPWQMANLRFAETLPTVAPRLRWTFAHSNDAARKPVT